MDLQRNIFRHEVAESPLRIIRLKTRQRIATSLDSRKLLLTKTGYHRDWRGLAEKANVDASVIRSSKISFTEHCLHLWTQKGSKIKEFWEALESIDRFDVIDDTLQNIYDDYDNAMSNDVLGLRPIPPPATDIQPSITDFDSNVLTTDDQKNLNDGGTLQFYDALVLFADEDLDFVDEMVQKLEGEYNLKLCLKDRDLVGGLSFEFSAVMRLIEERCARVIVVLSPAFLSSNANKFFTQFAHALSIDKQRRIVIPCMYKPCAKPPEISYCHSLDYFRTHGYWDYWKKLADSIVYKQARHKLLRAPSPKPVIRDVTDPSSPTTLASFPLRPASSPISLPSSSSNGVLARIRRKTGDWIDKRNSRLAENAQETFREEEMPSSNPVKREEEDSRIIALPRDTEQDSLSSGGRSPPHSPTSTSFSTSPLLPLPSPPHQEGGIRSMLKKVVKFKKKKGKEAVLA